MCMVMVVRHLTLRFMIPVLGLTAMIALALLYQLEPESYHRVIAFIGIEPSRFPFLDFQFILTAVDCWQRGVDVYANNPCDARSEEHTSELQSLRHLVCRLLPP